MPRREEIESVVSDVSEVSDLEPELLPADIKAEMAKRAGRDVKRRTNKRKNKH